MFSIDNQSYEYLKSAWLSHFDTEDKLIRETLQAGLTEMQAQDLMDAVESHPHAITGEQIDECLRIVKRF